MDAFYVVLAFVGALAVTISAFNFGRAYERYKQAVDSQTDAT